MALEMVKGEALHPHNSHDGLGRGLYVYMFQTKPSITTKNIT